MEDMLQGGAIIFCNRCIVPWLVVTVDPSSSFDDSLRSLKAAKYSIVSPSEFLSQAIIENVAICWKDQWLSQVSDDARELHAFVLFVFFFWWEEGTSWGHAPLVNACILEVATQSQIVLELGSC